MRLLLCGLTTLVLASCGGSNEESDESTSATPGVERVTRVTSPAPGSKLLRDPDLPFTLSYPPPYVEGRDDPSRGVAASLLIDRRNAIIVTEFGPAALAPDQLEGALAAKLQGRPGAPPLVREQRGENVVFTLTLAPSAPVAGQPVGARRLFFSAGDRVWEISCQFTARTRARAVRACDQIASSLRL
jgi:hypothetical protein